MDRIRNFVIIAHVDHGKSTLADRFLEVTGTVEKRLMKPQYLDQLELERERGITIKMAPVRMRYTLDDILYILNLIDTPGHSDFSYEVSRALAAVEGAILLVDATQGIQAQTLANCDAAQRAGLTLIGAVNKIDIAGEEAVRESASALARLLAVPPDQILRVSGKTGVGVPELLKAVVERIPSPRSLDPHISRALIFDSLYDDHKGVIAFVRVFGGRFELGAPLRFLATAASSKCKEAGYFAPALTSSGGLRAGDIGYLATGIKDPDKLTIGDTIVSDRSAEGGSDAELKLPGYREPKPVVFVSFYPEDPNRYDELRQALARLRLTDSSLRFESEVSEVLGRGWKGGFLGRLHFEITAERLAREFNIATVHSFPSVEYRVAARQGAELASITNPKDFPDEHGRVEEPVVRVELLTPPAYLGSTLGLTDRFRLSGIETETMNEKIRIRAKLPLADLIRDFDDKLKSVSQGFASLAYEFLGWEPASVEKLVIRLVGNDVPGLTRIVFAGDVEYEARRTVEKLKELLPREQFTQSIQAVVRGRIIARETVPAMRKDVTGYLYGGDRTRKMKLWKKQQAGKKRLAERAAVHLPKISAAIFRELLKSE